MGFRRDRRTHEPAEPRLTDALETHRLGPKRLKHRMVAVIELPEPLEAKSALRGRLCLTPPVHSEPQEALVPRGPTELEGGRYGVLCLCGLADNARMIL